jgi:hypothetical protein
MMMDHRRAGTQASNSRKIWDFGWVLPVGGAAFCQAIAGRKGRGYSDGGSLRREEPTVKRAMPRKMISMLLLAAMALTLVGRFASVAAACTPEGYVEELRPDGELPGGG